MVREVEKGGIFGSKDVWKRVQVYRHRQAVTKYILKLPAQLRGRVTQACRQILLDANVAITKACPDTPVHCLLTPILQHD